jgi:serine/threonine protein kinase
LGFLFSHRKFQVAPSKVIYSGGTPEYWSPEQGTLYDLIRAQVNEKKSYSTIINSLPNITNKIDVYSFGLIIWEILDGKKSWGRGDKIDHLKQGYSQQEYDPDLDRKSRVFYKFHQEVHHKLRLLALNCLEFQ